MLEISTVIATGYQELGSNRCHCLIPHPHHHFIHTGMICSEIKNVYSHLY